MGRRRGGCCGDRTQNRASSSGTRGAGREAGSTSRPSWKLASAAVNTWRVQRGGTARAHPSLLHPSPRGPLRSRACGASGVLVGEGHRGTRTPSKSPGRGPSPVFRGFSERSRGRPGENLILTLAPQTPLSKSGLTAEARTHFSPAGRSTSGGWGEMKDPVGGDLWVSFL